MSWRLWPIWLSSQAAERIEDKIDEIRRRLDDIERVLEHVDKMMTELMGPRR